MKADFIMLAMTDLVPERTPIADEPRPKQFDESSSSSSEQGQSPFQTPPAPTLTSLCDIQEA